MERPKILLTKEARGYKSIFNLILQREIKKGSEVEKELLEIVAKHSLVPEGGLYEVLVKTYDGQTLSFVGGMYVQPDRLDAVLGDLQGKGYEVVKKNAA